jgi:hypothetical protein
MIKQQLQSIEPALQPGDQVHKTVSYAYSLTKAGVSASLRRLFAPKRSGVPLPRGVLSVIAIFQQ